MRPQFFEPEAVPSAILCLGLANTAEGLLNTPSESGDFGFFGWGVRPNADCKCGLVRPDQCQECSRVGRWWPAVRSANSSGRPLTPEASALQAGCAARPKKSAGGHYDHPGQTSADKLRCLTARAVGRSTPPGPTCKAGSFSWTCKKRVRAKPPCHARAKGGA